MVTSKNFTQIEPWAFNTQHTLLRNLSHYCSDFLKLATEVYTLGNTTLPNLANIPPFRNTTLSPRRAWLCHIIAPTSATSLLRCVAATDVYGGEIQLYPLQISLLSETQLSPLGANNSVTSLLRPPPHYCSDLCQAATDVYTLGKYNFTILANIPPFRNTTLSPLSKQLCHIIAPTSATSLLRPLHIIAPTCQAATDVYTLGKYNFTSCKYPSFQKHNSLPSEQTTLSHHCSDLRHIIAPTSAKLPQMYTLWGNTTLSNSCKYPSFQKHNSLPSEQTTLPHHCSDLCQVCCRCIHFGEIQLYPILANTPLFKNTTLSPLSKQLRHIIALAMPSLLQMYTLWGNTTLSNSCKYPSFQKHNSLPSEQTTLSHHCSDLRHIIALAMPSCHRCIHFGEIQLYPILANTPPFRNTTLSPQSKQLCHIIAPTFAKLPQMYTLWEIQVIQFLQIPLLSKTQLSPLRANNSVTLLLWPCQAATDVYTLGRYNFIQFLQILRFQEHNSLPSEQTTPPHHCSDHRHIIALMCQLPQMYTWGNTTLPLANTSFQKHNSLPRSKQLCHIIAPMGAHAVP